MIVLILFLILIAILFGPLGIVGIGVGAGYIFNSMIHNPIMIGVFIFGILLEIGKRQLKKEGK